MARCALSVSTLAIPKALASWTTLSIDGVGGSRAANQLVCGLRRVSAPCRFLCCPAPWCVFGLFACIPEFPEACWTSDPVGFMYTVVQSFGFVLYAHNLCVYGVQSMSMMISTLISSLHVRAYLVAVRFFSIAEVAPWRGAAVSSMVVEFPAPAALGDQWAVEPPRIWTMLPSLPNSRHSSVGGCGRLRRSPRCRVRWEAGPRCWLWRVWVVLSEVSVDLLGGECTLYSILYRPVRMPAIFT